MNSQRITYSLLGQVAHLRLERIQAGNAIDAAMAGELREILGQVAMDDRVAALVISGATDFCVGCDPQAWREFEDPDEARRWLAVAEAIANLEIPTLAAVAGRALGQGLELALACDLRLASPEACFGTGGLETGRLPWDGGTQRLPRLVGRGLALEMLLTGRELKAPEALERGLITRLIPTDELERQALALAGEMTSRAAVSMRFVKEAIHQGLDLTLPQGLRLEVDLYFLMHSTGDRSEGIQAFRDKRPPSFQGA